jgi:thiamine biosynthesis lipoprotein
MLGLLALSIADLNPISISAKSLHLHRFEFAQTHMWTRFRIIVYSEKKKSAERAAAAAFRRIALLESIFSDYRDDSELNVLCQKSGGPPVRVSRDLFRILKASVEISEKTSGAFDITMGPVVRLWRTARKNKKLPEKQEIAKALELTGYKKIHLLPQSRSVALEKAGMQLDLGGIAKGYAADEAMAVLKRYGLYDSLVAAGGEVVAGEAPPGRKGWIVEVGHPDTDAGKPHQYILLRYASVSTSGDAEQFLEVDGVRYSHIVDPRTGIGIRGRNSVTVKAPSGTLSDSIATSINVLGPEAGLGIAESMPGIAVFIITEKDGDLLELSSRSWEQLKKTETAPSKSAELLK